MNKKTYHQIRNYLHIVGFFTLAYWLLHGLGIIDFYLWQKIIGCAFIGISLGGTIAISYEFARLVIFKDPAEQLDVIRSTIGFVIGTYLVAFFENITFILIYMFYFCLTLFVLDLVNAIRKK